MATTQKPQKPQPLLKINGVEIKCPSSFKYTRQDYDLDSARSVTGEMVRQRICTKVKLELTWLSGEMDMKSMSTLLKAFDDIFFEVTYYDIHDGAFITKTFYVGDRTAQMYSYVNGKPVFNEISFNLIER